MKVFVTGATGFVGQEILRGLRNAGHSIRFLAREHSGHVAQQFAPRFRVEASLGDVLDPGSLDNALAGTNAVIHLVGIISEVGENTFENVHTRGTQSILAAAQRAGVRRFVHMSALGTRPDAVSRYHKSKWAAEEEVRNAGLDYTIFRPSLIYGRKDHFVNLFAKIIRCSPIIPVLGNPKAKFQPVPVEAVAISFVKSLSEPRSIGATFDLCGSETLTMPEILDQISQVMGHRRLKLRVPAMVAKCEAAFLEFVFPRLLRKAAPLNRDQLIMLQEDNVGNGNPASELFGLESTSFRQGIARYLGKA